MVHFREIFSPEENVNYHQIHSEQFHSNSICSWFSEILIGAELFWFQIADLFKSKWKEFMVDWLINCLSLALIEHLYKKIIQTSNWLASINFLLFFRDPHCAQFVEMKSSLFITSGTLLFCGFSCCCISSEIIALWHWPKLFKCEDCTENVFLKE